MKNKKKKKNLKKGEKVGMRNAKGDLGLSRMRLILAASKEPYSPLPFSLLPLFPLPPTPSPF